MSPERDEASTAGTVRGLGDQQIQRRDSANCTPCAQAADHPAADHPDNADDQGIDKEFATARAELAIRGFVLQRIDDADGRAAYLVSRWNMSRSLPDLSAVHDFAERAGVPHG